MHRTRAGGIPRTVLAGGVAAGFAALAASGWTARAAPTAGYELSIYAGTPPGVWVGVAVAGALALVAVLAAPTLGVRLGGLALGASTVTLVSLLPLLRNYRFQGPSDSLTHLGWTGDLLAGTLDPTGLLYPGVHAVAVQLHAVGLSVERALMLTVVVFTVAFLVGVPLAVRAVTDDGWAVALAAVSSWFLLPLNHVGVHMLVFPTTQALFFLPFWVLAFALFLRRRDAGAAWLPGGVSPTALLLGLFGIAVVLIHPQQAVNLVLVLLAGSVLQVASGRYRPEHRINDNRSLHAQTLFLVAAFLAWTAPRERFRGTVETMLANLAAPGAESVDAVAQRGASLTSMGVGLETLFVRLFLVATVYTVLSAGLFVALVRGRAGLDPGSRTTVAYLVAALVPSTALFGVYFVSTPTLGFRQLGFLMVFGTLLGAMALAALSGGLRARLPSPATRSVLGVVLAALLVVSLLTVFPSPVVYKTSGQVTDQQWEGNALAIRHQGEGMGYARLTLSPHVYRYGDAILGVDGNADVDYDATTVPADSFNDGTVSAAYDDTRYFKVTEADYRREVMLYDEFRHSRTGFERLSTDPGLNRVASNGMYRLYVVDGTA
jgi:hypothetical protein